MKNPNKKIMMAICAALLLQSGTTVFGMERARRAYQAARSKVSDRWQILRGDIGKLQDALACIKTNSCNSQQQAYIKSMVKKLAVGIAAAAATCGIYAVAKSKQYEGLQEDVSAVRNIAQGFGVTNPESVILLENIKRFTDVLGTGDKNEIDARYDRVMAMKDMFGGQPEAVYKAVHYILQRYGGVDERARKLGQMIGSAAVLAKKQAEAAR